EADWPASDFRAHGKAELHPRLPGAERLDDAGAEQLKRRPDRQLDGTRPAVQKPNFHRERGSTETADRAGWIGTAHHSWHARGDVHAIRQPERRVDDRNIQFVDISALPA